MSHPGLSQRARMSGELIQGMSHNQKKKKKKKNEWWDQIFIKLNFRELWDSKLPGLHSFDNMAIILWFKMG